MSTPSVFAFLLRQSSKWRYFAGTLIFFKQFIEFVPKFLKELTYTDRKRQVENIIDFALSASGRIQEPRLFSTRNTK